jgi:hypothetical protein
MTGVLSSLAAHDQRDPFGAVSEPALVADLRLLLGGPGVQSGQDMARIGPALRMMCGIASSDSAADAVSAIAAWLRPRIQALSADGRRCALLAFGLHETVRDLNRGARFAALADQLGRGPDTARRRMAAVISEIARATTPGQSIPLQLRACAGTWVDLGMAQDRQDGSRAVVTACCFLVAAVRPVDQRDKVYALIRFTSHHRVLTAVPAVRVRHVTPASHPGPDTIGERAARLFSENT